MLISVLGNHIGSSNKIVNLNTVVVFSWHYLAMYPIAENPKSFHN